ncbi:putative beta-glucosidase 6 [Thrips palmi]|uniref:Beta-glucosidase 6 n=1 Tax=Thrips palmi TaxID=161013 RepID=A0A6P9AM88_THRPL|nr:putative beta-glucosidase 6 [Thrips palmi]
MAVLILVLLALAAGGHAAVLSGNDDELYAVPDGLLIGAGVSAFQTEGAWNEEGKAESAADHLFRTGNLTSMGVTDPHLQDRAADSYHRYKEDIRMAAELKLKLYRFSLSWSRLLPTANAAEPNPQGVDFYRNFISEILRYNMTPLATLYHFDHPQILEDQFHGWQSPQMVVKFKEYAEFVFKEFGSMVPLWVTLNEPNMYCSYFPSMFIAGGLYKPEDQNWYSCIRHAILGHAEAYHAFKAARLQGQIGFSAVLMTGYPNTTRAEDVYAAAAYNSLQAGVVLDPVVYGDYSQLTKEILGSKLVPFSEEEKKLIKGSTDFLGYNIYDGGSVSWQNPNASSGDPTPFNGSPLQEVRFFITQRSKSLIDFYAIRECVVWAWTNYRVPVLITENGIGRNDIKAAYHSAYLRMLVKTVKEFDIKVIGYTAWSLIDAFEFTGGFTRPYGLIHVDYENGTLERSHKDSASFWIEMADTGNVPLVNLPSSATASCVSILLLCASLVFTSIL